jgi:hypothetical protein
VKNTFGFGGAALLALAMLAGSAFAADTTAKSDLTDVVKWGVWHEGCSIYTADNAVGDTEQIRECLVRVYAQNQYAQQRVRNASRAMLASAVNEAAKEIPSERQFERFLEFACENAGLLPKFKQMADVADFAGMRTLFYNTFMAQPEIKNLAAAVSNKELSSLINQFELADHIREMRSQPDQPAHVPMPDAD